MLWSHLLGFSISFPVWKLKEKNYSDLNLKCGRRACSTGFYFLYPEKFVFTDLCFKSSIIRVNCWQQACLFQKPCWHCCGLETDQRAFPKNSGQLILWTVWTVFFAVLHLLCSAYKFYKFRSLHWSEHWRTVENNARLNLWENLCKDMPPENLQGAELTGWQFSRPMWQLSLVGPRWNTVW